MAEPCVAEVAGGRLILLARTGSGSLHRSWSEDGGDTWSRPEPTTLISPCSSLTLKTLPDGRLIVFYNHVSPLRPGAFFPRIPLCYAVSDDGGQTWGEPVIVGDEGAIKRDHQSIYPAICFLPDGMLVVWSMHAADPDGTFDNGGAEGWRTGGAKRAVLAYPE
jgi:alpha-L-rhamnosidase